MLHFKRVKQAQQNRKTQKVQTHRELSRTESPDNPETDKEKQQEESQTKKKTW